MEKKELDQVLLKKIFILFLAFIGFLTTIKLAFIYYDANFNPYALPSFCSVSEFVDCDGVAQTIHSQFFGVPLAYWGMFFYVFIIFMLFVDKLKNIKSLGFLRVFEHPFMYICSLGVISFVISIALAMLSIFEMKKVCILCFFTYFLNLLIAIIAGLGTGLFNSFKISISDFVNAIKVKQYLISFLVLILLASVALTYTTTSYIFTPQVKHYVGIKQYADMKTNPFKVNGNVLGDKNAKTLVYIYTDYRCPICKVFNIMIFKAAKEVKGIKIIHKNLPLDAECNKALPSTLPGHEGSCMLSRYSIAAENQGDLWGVNSEIFEKQPKNEEEVIKLAKSDGLDTAKLKKDANSAETKEKLNNDINTAIKLKINGTPTMVINGVVYTGIKPYNELRDILKRASTGEKK